MTKSSPLIWHLLHNVKLMVKISINFVAFLGNINFKNLDNILQFWPQCSVEYVRDLKFFDKIYVKLSFQLCAIWMFRAFFITYFPQGAVINYDVSKLEIGYLPTLFYAYVWKKGVYFSLKMCWRNKWMVPKEKKNCLNRRPAVKVCQTVSKLECDTWISACYYAKLTILSTFIRGGN